MQELLDAIGLQQGFLQPRQLSLHFASTHLNLYPWGPDKTDARRGQRPPTVAMDAMFMPARFMRASPADR